MSYILKYKQNERVYAYNESDDSLISVGKIIKANAECGTYTIHNIPEDDSEITVFHTCVYRIGTGPMAAKVKQEKVLINQLEELNPKAADNIREIVKGEFQYLAQHMIDNSDEYFYDEVALDTDNQEEIEVINTWLRHQVSDAIADVIKTFKSQL